MFESWRRSWDYNTVYHTTPVISENDLKDGFQRDSLEDQPLAGVSHEDLQLIIRRQKYVWKYGLLAIVVAIIFGLFVFLVVNSQDHNGNHNSYDNSNDDGNAIDIEALTHVSSVTKTNNKPHLCGNSSAQAQELGCTFNQLMWTWLPPNCPHYANDLFMSAEEQPWVFYEDLEQTRVVEGDSWKQVLDGELRVFGERREHVTHCVFLLLSLAQILRDGTPYYEKLVDYEHSEHCANMLLEIVRKEPGWNDLQTIGGTVSFDQHCGDKA